MPSQLDPLGDDVGRRAVGVAAGAGVVAEVADEGALVRVRGAAATAVLGVVGVLELGQGLAGVVDPEVGHPGPAGELAIAPEVGDQRVVGVEHEAGAPGALGHQRRPIVGQRLELAVAVELVAEEVGEHDQLRLQLGGHLRQPGLVDLEQALVRRPVRAGPWRRPRSCSTRRDCGRARDRRRAGRRRSCPAVVVLPLVALITSSPRSGPRRGGRSRRGPSRRSMRPGSVVPPPRPLRRLSAPVALARAALARKSVLMMVQARRARVIRSARAAALSVAGRSARWSPSA